MDKILERYLQVEKKQQHMKKNPTAFISYSWENDSHKDWVKKLAAKLRKDGVDVKLDQWELEAGDQIPLYMQKSISENNFVFIICTPAYKRKSDNREGGVGYEGDIISAEVLQNQNHKKFIPILRKGNWQNSAPNGFQGKYYIDLSPSVDEEINYKKLVATVLNTKETAPQIGQNRNEITDTTIQILKERAYDIFKFQESSWFSPSKFDFLEVLNYEQKFNVLSYIIEEFLQEDRVEHIHFINYLLENAVYLFELPQKYQKQLDSLLFIELPKEEIFYLIMENNIDFGATISYIERKQLIDHKTMLYRIWGLIDLFSNNSNIDKNKQIHFKQIRYIYQESLKRNISKCYGDFNTIDISKFDLIPGGGMNFDFDYSYHIQDKNPTELFLYEYYTVRRDLLDKGDFELTVFSLYKYCKKMIKHNYLESSRLLFVLILDFEYWNEQMGKRFENLPLKFHLNKLNELIRAIKNPFYKVLFLYHVYVTLYHNSASGTLLKKYERRILNNSKELLQNTDIHFNKELIALILENLKYYPPI